MKTLAAFFLLLILSCSVHGAESEAWFDGSRKIRLWRHGHSAEHESPIYSESPNPKAGKQVLSGNIIVAFFQDKSWRELESFMETHKLAFVKKLPLGSAIYLFRVEGDKETSLSIANSIHKSGEAKASYPDWIYINKLF